MTIHLVIPGEPVAQARPRFSSQGGHVRAYDPAKSRDYKQYIRLAASQQMGTTPPLEGALALGMCVYRAIPKSFSKRRRDAAERGEIWPTTKPDLDNYVKAAKDALNGIVWADDSQIVSYIEPFGKFYSDKPRIEITVTQIEGGTK
jgi:Holliday junction resolvase RusA-like endonuclease